MITVGVAGCDSGGAVLSVVEESGGVTLAGFLGGGKWGGELGRVGR